MVLGNLGLSEKLVASYYVVGRDSIFSLNYYKIQCDKAVYGHYV